MSINVIMVYRKYNVKLLKSIINHHAKCHTKQSSSSKQQVNQSIGYLNLIEALQNAWEDSQCCEK